ncbi:MAG: glycoside hydrolase family 127 protein, partial [Candidatus Symbiothrix sp.]|nr:glycoside hydrolase family 127 protein [Candidatus Symbiothrix sp.]
MKRKILISGVVLFCFFGNLPAQSIYPGQFEDKVIVKNTISGKALNFDLKDVRLLDSPFKSNMERDGKWLLSITADQWSHAFRYNAGLRCFRRDELGGWEKLEVRGHSTAHALSALALMYASTGDNAYKVKGDSIIAALAEVQQVLNQDGYLSAFPIHYMERNIDHQQVWAPWYVIHKILAGLVDMYLYTDNKQALEVATQLGMWSYRTIASVSDEQLDKILIGENGAMPEV